MSHSAPSIVPLCSPCVEFGHDTVYLTHIPFVLIKQLLCARHKQVLTEAMNRVDVLSFGACFELNQLKK